MDSSMNITRIKDGKRVWNKNLCDTLTTQQFTKALFECGFTERFPTEGYYFLSNKQGESIVIQVFLPDGLYQILDFQPTPSFIKEAHNLFNEIRGAWRQVRG